MLETRSAKHRQELQQCQAFTLASVGFQFFAKDIGLIPARALMVCIHTQSVKEDTSNHKQREVAFEATANEEMIAFVGRQF